MIYHERLVAQRDRLSDEFPAFHISLEPMARNVIRFVARNRYPEVHPRTVITSDAAELRAALLGDAVRTGTVVSIESGAKRIVDKPVVAILSRSTGVWGRRWGWNAAPGGTAADLTEASSQAPGFSADAS